MPGIKSKMDSAVPDQTDSSGDRQDESTNRKQDTEAQNPLKAKSQRLTTKKRPGPYSCVKVLLKSQVIDDPYVNGAGSGSGSLTLCYENNIKHTIPYNYIFYSGMPDDRHSPAVPGDGIRQTRAGSRRICPLQQKEWEWKGQACGVNLRV